MLLSVEINAIIDAAAELVNYNDKGKSYDNKLSNSYLVKVGLDGELRRWADYFGIDFDATEYTFETSYTKVDGEVTKFVNQPRVVLAKGLPVLVWGKVEQPLSNITNRYLFVKEGKYTHVVAGAEGDEDQLKLYVALKDKETETTELNRAKREGDWVTLASYLVPDRKFTHPTKVAKNVKLRVYGDHGKDGYGKYLLEVEGHGLVATNTAMKRTWGELIRDWRNKPELKQYPVYVEFGNDYKSRDGKLCVSVRLWQDVPVAKFDLSEVMSY